MHAEFKGGYGMMFRGPKDVSQVQNLEKCIVLLTDKITTSHHEIFTKTASIYRSLSAGASVLSFYCKIETKRPMNPLLGTCCRGKFWSHVTLVCHR
jgi:hypothetical protein